MGWVSTVDYEESIPVKRRGTKKKVWDELTQTWKDVTIWTVDNTRQLHDWLKENYPDNDGWNTAWSGNKIVFYNEQIYTFYCLKFEM